MKIHGVTTSYIRALAELGYDAVPTSGLVSMQIRDVTISCIRKLQQEGHDHLSPDELIARRIHGY